MIPGPRLNAGARQLSAAPVLFAIAVLAIASCTAKGGSVVGTTSTTTTVGEVVGSGPFDGLRGPTGAARVGSLLHDDTDALWEVDLETGERTMLWDHPRALVTGVSAAPDGDLLAMTVTLEVDRRDQLSSVLYLWHPDGSIESVDRVSDFGQIYDPAFLRSPWEDTGEVYLYWNRTFDGTDVEHDRLRTAVLARPISGGPIEEVAISLRDGESPGAISSYPGNIAYTLSLIRVDADPTALEVMIGRVGSEEEPWTRWSRLRHRANTESLLSDSWLSPYDYVVVRQAHDDPTGHLTFSHFVRTCDTPFGSLLVYDGLEIDDARSEVAWDNVAVATNELLVLTNADIAASRADEAARLTWSALSIETGKLRATDIEWARGPWTFVWPDIKGDPEEFQDCEGWREHPNRVPI